jgi:nucleotide-binding universal stress UspA family protein
MSCYHKILIAHDGSADADAALEQAVRLARDQHACLTLLTVVPLPHQPPSMSAQATPDLSECFTASLRRAADSVPPDIGLTTRVLRGTPADVILRCIREGDHDIVVMGSHGHSRLHRALLGSVSHRVLRDSPVPVMLIRRKTSAQAAPSVSGDAAPDPERPASGSVPPAVRPPRPIAGV